MMMRWTTLGTSAVLAGMLAVALQGANAPRVARNVAYGPPENDQARLDVYSAEGKGRPIVIWVHGGGWWRGDKANVRTKPKAFNSQGYVFISVNYRLGAGASFKEQASDIARAVRWARDHAREHGGDPDRIFLMGHSAGAHLAALVGTDHRYLGVVGLKPSDLRGVVLVDGAAYDVPRQVRQARIPKLRALYLNAFTRDEAVQKDGSPTAHVARGQSYPPFLALYVTSRLDAQMQSKELVAKLSATGAEARAVACAGKTHGTINRDLGNANDAPSREMFQFLRDHAAKPRDRKPGPARGPGLPSREKTGPEGPKSEKAAVP